MTTSWRKLYKLHININTKYINYKEWSCAQSKYEYWTDSAVQGCFLCSIKCCFRWYSTFMYVLLTFLCCCDFLLRLGSLDNHNNCWFWFSIAALIPPLRFTKTWYLSGLNLVDSMSIISVKIVSNIYFPINVYDTIIARNSVDHISF